MKVTSNLRPTYKIIELEGRIDASNYLAFREKLLGDISEDDNVILNLEKLEFIDSSGLGVFVRVQKTLNERDLKLCLVNMNNKIRLVFEITRANRVFEIFDNIEMATRYAA